MLTEKVAIYIPGTVNRDNPNIDEQRKRTRQLLVSLSSLFGGATSIEGQGSWVDESGQLISEPVTICYSFTDSTTLQEKRGEVYSLCKQLCHDMRQDCVSLEIDGGLEFIDNQIGELKDLVSQLTQ